MKDRHLLQEDPFPIYSILPMIVQKTRKKIEERVQNGLALQSESKNRPDFLFMG
ncbi:GntR family transcriptional regulator [Streptococcus iniae]